MYFNIEEFSQLTKFRIFNLTIKNAINIFLNNFSGSRVSTLNLKRFNRKIYFLALTMSINSGLRDAPPTKKPSMSGWEASSLQLAAVTDPPY